jgi:uncharacterized membrane protein
MTKQRLEAFSDGVIAILITIMVLELKVPHDTSWHALGSVAPTFLSYVLSYVYVGIYWNNHHHLMHLVDKINGGIMWANLHLLFWLSLISFTTGWMGENHNAPLPTAMYGVCLLLCALAWWVLQSAIIAHQGPRSRLAEALGPDLKVKLSPLLYLLAIPLAFVNTVVSDVIYAAVAAMWLVPDRRIEAKVKAETGP